MCIRDRLSECLSLIRETLELSDDTEIIPFSAEKGTGRDTLIGVIENAAKG